MSNQLWVINYGYTRIGYYSNNHMFKKEFIKKIKYYANPNLHVLNLFSQVIKAIR